MTIGRGKYDEIAREIAIRTGASGIVLVVAGGNRGDGLSVIGETIDLLIDVLPDMMERAADELRDEAREARRRGVKPS